MVALHFGSRTDVGRVRQVNEDSYLAAPPIFVVADGMGGHYGGDVASQIAVAEFAHLGDDGYDARSGTAAIAAALRESQRKINGIGAPGEQFAGTTVVVALLVDEPEGARWLLANLGDSRIYRYADDVLEQVSVDHSVVQELVDAGTISAAEAAAHPEAHVITRALGGPGEVDPDFFSLPVAAAPRLVLCSDGVSGMIDDDELATILAMADDPRDAADRMVEAALEAGGKDNATVVVIDVVGLTEEQVYDAARERISLERKLGALP